MTSFIAAGGSGRSTSVIPAVPAASSVTTIAFIRHLPLSSSRLLHRRQSSSHADMTARDQTRSPEHAACSLPHRGGGDSLGGAPSTVANQRDKDAPRGLSGR